MKLSNEDWLAIDQELAGRSLAEFTKMAWHILEPATPLKWGWALDAMCEHLEAVSYGEILRLLMNVPPGTMKSLLTGVVFPAWEWGPRQKAHLKYLGTAHKADLATRDNLKCRRLIQSPWFQDRWPITLTSDQNAKTKFENDQSGFRESMSFTSLTGSRGDRVLLDDPHSVADANSAAHLAAGVREFREALPSRVNNDESAIVIIMQRLHEADVSSVALDFGYDHLCIPMRYEPKTTKTTSLGWRDPRTKDGELMFPERFPENQVAELERSLGTYKAAGQLQQRPAPAEGGIFKEHWLKYWTATPKIEYYNIYADTAQKKGEDNDYACLQMWGKAIDGRIYLFDIVHEKLEAPELLATSVAFWDKHKAELGSKLRRMKIEDKSSGTGLIQQMKKKGIAVDGIPRSNDKISRAHDTAPQIEAGNVVLPERHQHLLSMTSEIKLFPNAKNDDTVDPLMDAVQDMLNEPPKQKAKLRKVRGLA